MSSDRAAFLGPQSENGDILERLILDALRDHIYWRRNFHPEDPPAILESERIQQPFLDSTAELQKELFSILADLKRGVPFFSPRYLGHINADLLIPALVGYFAAMLYNQNNVVAESSPITVVKELEYISALADMLGLPKLDLNRLSSGMGETSWGHLSSGGTTANFEAIWTARNVQFYPLSVRLLGEMSAEFSVLKNIMVTCPNGTKSEIGEMSPYQLLSLAPTAAIGLRNDVADVCSQNISNRRIEDKLPSVQRLGLVGLWNLCNERNLAFQMPRILLPKTKHYCWPKAADLLGLGGSCLMEVEVDGGFRMDLESLSNKLEELNRNLVPVLSLITICGTTEEGALDPLHQILKMRQKCGTELNLSFWLHSDAAFGGYFASMLRGETEIENERFAAISALGGADSVAIDPHKLGYIPYPAGAILYRDGGVRDFISYDAPYLKGDEDITRAFLGKWTLEGSRPGAAAISCYLAQHCYPLTANGHGALLSKCIDATERLIEGFSRVNEDPQRNRNFKIVSLFEPELNIVCYALASRGAIKSLSVLNSLTNAIFSEMTVAGDYHANHYAYVVAKTDYDVARYSKQIESFLQQCEVPLPPNDQSLVTLRSVLMNPLSPGQDHFEVFAERLCEIAERCLPRIRLGLIEKAFGKREGGRRMKILIVEDTVSERDSLKNGLEMEQPVVSSGLETRTASSLNEGEDIFKEFKPDAAVIDLKLGGDFHGMELIRRLQELRFENVVVYSAYLEDPIIKAQLDELGVSLEQRIMKSTPVTGNPTDHFGVQYDVSVILNLLFSFLDR